MVNDFGLLIFSHTVLLVEISLNLHALGHMEISFDLSTNIVKIVVADWSLDFHVSDLLPP